MIQRAILVFGFSVSLFSAASGRTVEFNFSHSKNTFDFEHQKRQHKLTRIAGNEPPGIEYIELIAYCDPKDKENYVQLYYSSYCKIKKASFDRHTSEVRLQVLDFIPEDPQRHCMKNYEEIKIKIINLCKK